MKINLINLINLIDLISKHIPIQKFSKLGLGAFLDQLEIRVIRNLLFPICIFAYLFICLFLPQSASAQSPKGITVIPSIHYMDLSTDSPEYLLRYVNNTKSDINLTLSSQDFTELEEGYKISFLEGKDAANYKYSLSSWISFENKNLELLPGEEKSVKVFIDKNRITKGGHYASILAKVETPKNEKAITIHPVISSLLFVRASTGREVESGKISSFRTDRNTFEFPESFITRFQNSGNVHVIPYGLIRVFDPMNREVGKGIFNEGSLNALPESIRRYETKTNKNSKLLLPGLYTARIDLHFGKSNQKLSEELKFFSWGSFNFLKIGLILILIITAGYFVRKRKKKIN